MINLLIEKAVTQKELQDLWANQDFSPLVLPEVVAEFANYLISISGLARPEIIELEAEVSQVGMLMMKEAASNKVFLQGNFQTYQVLKDLLAKKEKRLFQIGKLLTAALANYEGELAPLVINSMSYDWKRPYIMGIINLTPDSFSGDGIYGKDTSFVDAALKQAAEMIAAGADFLDVGAESTRPGAAQISTEEEKARLIPIIKELAHSFSVPISVDTYKAAVAAQALEAGAALINDVWGLQSPEDPQRLMAKLAAAAGVPVILMHNQRESEYQSFLPEVISFLQESLRIAAEAGIAEEKIILDPGVGFGKKYQHNLLVLKHLEKFKILGKPLLLGTSRKSFIGLTLDLSVSERLEGSVATNLWGTIKGANIVRVHDVQAVARAIRMGEKIEKA